MSARIAESPEAGATSFGLYASWTHGELMSNIIARTIKRSRIDHLELRVAALENALRLTLAYLHKKDDEPGKLIVSPSKGGIKLDLSSFTTKK